MGCGRKAAKRIREHPMKQYEIAALGALATALCTSASAQAQIATDEAPEAPAAEAPAAALPQAEDGQAQAPAPTAPAATPSAEAPAATPPVVTPTSDTADASASADEDEDEEEEEKDGFRMRGGFNLAIGGGFIPDKRVVGPAPGLNFRIGPQFSHLFSLLYQGMALGSFMWSEDGTQVAAGAAIYNSIMPLFTLAHTFDLGLAPSVDILAAGMCDADAIGCGGSVQTAFGLHGRFAINIGGLSGSGPRRSGFNLAVDVHPVFVDPLFLSTTLGIGGEWY